MVGLRPPKVYWFERHGFKIQSFESTVLKFTRLKINKNLCSEMEGL